MSETNLKLRLPITAWLTLIGVVAAGAIAWGTTKQDVARNTEDIRALQSDRKSDRELLVRIDENVKALKEAQSQHR